MTDSTKYCERFIPQASLDKLEAGAFRQLCEHLRQRSEEVQNIDMMTVSGFCRNCLSKWLVLEARNLGDKIKKSGAATSEEELETIKALDALGYDEAAEYVYGIPYGDWKQRYSKKASDEVMEKYKASSPIHAKHDKDLLATRSDKPTSPANEVSDKSTVLSNVCCQDPEQLFSSGAAKVAASGKNVRVATPLVPPPPSDNIKFSIGVLTVSDRAASGKYTTGDLSGPAVEKAISSTVKHIMLSHSGRIEFEVKESAIVPDNIESIENRLTEWSSGEHSVDWILTTGGTGFAPRDVTPEATRAILDRESHGLMSFISSETSKVQPLAALTRGTAGIRGRTFIVNLPGNPKGVKEIMPLLMPLALHAISDLQSSQ